jgi:hypothetical protein
MSTQKTITINGTRYTAAKLRKLAKTGDEFKGGDIAFAVPGGEIAIREYPNEGEIAVLSYGLASHKDKTWGAPVAFLA